MLKLSNLYTPLFVLVIVIISLVISRILFSKKIELDKFFNSTQSAPPQGLSFKVNGVAGDSVLVSIPTHILLPGEQFDSEILAITPKTADEIRDNLDNSSLLWELLTKQSSSIFLFNLDFISDKSSPNNGKKDSVFSLFIATDTPQQILPGQKVNVGHNLDIEAIVQILASSKITLANQNGFYQAFFDKNGSFISQGTGTFEIKPTLLTWIISFTAFWVLILAGATLIKQTILLSDDTKKVINFIIRLFSK